MTTHPSTHPVDKHYYSSSESDDQRDASHSTAEVAKLLGRECGTCFACCVWLGIDARPTISKHAGQYCKMLANPKSAHERCAIYDVRPKACERYLCGWLAGFGRHNDRPNISGVLITPYDFRETKRQMLAGEINALPDPADVAFTVTICDEKLAGTINDPMSNLTLIVADILAKCEIEGIDVEIRVVNHVTRQVFRLRNNTIQSGVALPSRHPEDLKMMLTGTIAPFALFSVENKDGE